MWAGLCFKSVHGGVSDFDRWVEALELGVGTRRRDRVRFVYTTS